MRPGGRISLISNISIFPSIRPSGLFTASDIAIGRRDLGDAQESVFGTGTQSAARPT